MKLLQQHRDITDVMMTNIKPSMLSHHNTDSKVSKKNIFSNPDGTTVIVQNQDSLERQAINNYV